MSETSQAIATIDALLASSVTIGAAPDPVYTFDLGIISPGNLYVLIEAAIGHKMRNECGAKVSAARIKLARDAVAALPKEEQAAARADWDKRLAAAKGKDGVDVLTDDEREAILLSAEAAMFETITKGVIGRRAAGERASPLAAKMRSMAKEALSAAGIKFGKKLSDPVTGLADAVMTGDELLGKWVAKNYQHYMVEIEKERKALEKKANSLKLKDGGLSLDSLGLV